MSAREDGTGRKDPTSRQKAGRAMPVKPGGLGRLGKRAVRVSRIEPRQRGGGQQRRGSGR